MRSGLDGAMRPLVLAVLLSAGLPSLVRAAPDAPRLAFPLACEIGRTCEVQHYVDRDPGPGVLDYRCGHRTYDGHNGIDIRLLDMAQQRRGVDVLAAAPGRVARLRDGVADISIRDPGAPSVKGQECGNGVVLAHGDGWETQYCHLAKGSVRVKVGDTVRAGDPIGRVGLSGDTEFPHLHVTARHAGKVVDPFAPSPAPGATCAADARLAASMWTPAAQKALGYKAGAILNAGFSGAPVTMPMIEAGGIAAPDGSSPVLVVYLRAIELAKGDVMSLSLKGPDGTTIAAQDFTPLERDKAQVYGMIGRKRPAQGWPRGRYSAVLRVVRDGKTVIERQIAVVI
jgi:hypothetical protein